MLFIEKIIKRFINSEFIINNIDFKIIDTKLKELICEKNSSLVQIGEGSRFYPESEVINLQNRKDKISLVRTCSTLSQSNVWFHI